MGKGFVKREKYVPAGHITSFPGSRQPGAAERRKSMLTLALLLVVCCLGINRELWTPDEPREAEISREMLLAPGVVPSLNGHRFIEKPPLYYWTVAGVFALTGGPSAPAARSVSMAASFLTLLLVFLWGRREFSADVGLIAAVGLATSFQFMVSSHWILLDPLLMLSTTAAAWAGWELVQGRGGWRRALQFYLAVVAALWIKGLIGPVLLGCGLLAYAAWSRSLTPIRRLHPLAGIAVLLGATALLAFLIYLQGGADAVREWLWVNHVERFVAPELTGHAQPFYYYLYTLLIAVFPWWVPLVDVLRPGRWRGDHSPWKPMKVYLATLCAGMLVILSVSVTKRGTYLLPVLPLLFLLLATQAAQWWQKQDAGFRGNSAWWLQIGLIGLLVIGPVLIMLVRLKTPVPHAIAFLAAVAALTAALIAFSRRGDWPRALPALVAYALSSVIGLVVITAQLVAPEKDMAPFVKWFASQIPRNLPIYASGHIDETLQAIVPFVTGRRLIEIAPAEIDARQPPYLLVQNKAAGATASAPGTSYVLVGDHNFGPGRYFSVWRRGGD